MFKESKGKKLLVAGILLIIFVVGYFLIKQFGLLEVLSKLNDQKIGYGMIFVIGLLASFHCVGMCGGLVVAYSAKNKDGHRSHIQYNLGRFVSYSIIGGILGGVGSFFGINRTVEKRYENYRRHWPRRWNWGRSPGYRCHG